MFKMEKKNPVLKFTVHEGKLYEEKNSLMRVIFRLSFSVLQKAIQHAYLTNWSIQISIDLLSPKSCMYI